MAGPSTAALSAGDAGEPLSLPAGAETVRAASIRIPA
jgi:hypothetical protein